MWKVSLGWTIKNSAFARFVAEQIAIGINYNYAVEIIKKYNELGEEGVKNLKKEKEPHLRGKKSLLTQEKLKKLSIALESKPSDAGISTGNKVAR